VLFHEPVRGLVPFGAPQHPGLTVTVADRDRFADALRAVTDFPFGHGAGLPFGHGAGLPFGHGAGL
jgi:hypothetical protein